MKQLFHSTAKFEGKNKRTRRTFSIGDKIKIVEDVLSGKVDINHVIDQDGEKVHYGSIDNWISSYLSGRFNGVNPDTAYAKVSTTTRTFNKNEQERRKAIKNVVASVINTRSSGKPSAKDKLMAKLEELKAEEVKKSSGKKTKSKSIIDQIQKMVLEKD